MKRKLAHLVLGGWANILLNAILGIYVARVLGPAEKGVLALALGSVLVLSMLLSFGAPHAAAYFVRSRPGSARSILGYINLTMSACCAFSALLLLIGNGPFSRLFLDGREMTLLFMVLLVLATVVGSANTILHAVVVALGAAKTGALSLNIGTAVNAALTVLLLTQTSLRVEGVVAGTLAGQIVGSLMLRARILRQANAEESQALSLREFFAYGMKAQLGAVASLAFKRLDLFFIGYFLNPSAVGFYSIGLSLRDTALVVCRSLSGLVAGELADPKALGSRRKLLLKSIWLTLGFSLFTATGAWVLFPTVIPWVYSEAYREAALPAVIIMASAVPLSLAVLIAAVGNSFGKPLLVSGANVAAAVAGAGLIWFLTSRYGLLGAACSAVLSALVLLVVQGVVFQVRIRENRR